MREIKFGTDGWRAVIGEDFTFDNVRRVAQAMAGYLNKEGASIPARDSRIMVGYDTRFMSDKYAETIARVLAANGVRTILSDRPTPTPSVSYAIKRKGLRGGVMVTASHNPARYNGIKFKAYYGGSAPLEVTRAFEARLASPEAVKIEKSAQLKEAGLIETEDIITPHLAFIKKFVDIKAIKKSGMKVLVDSMYGTGDRYIAGLLNGGACKIDTIHAEDNPGFGGINPEPIMPNLKELAAMTKKGRYGIGLATDGDADRLGVALPDGLLMTGHKMMTLLLLHLYEDRSVRGDVVQTICGTTLIDKICARYGIKTHQTKVGFKYIAEKIIAGDVLIGGEETGGVAFKGYIPERDGILSGLLILEMLAVRKKKVMDIIKAIDKEYGTFEYRRLDMKYPDQKKPKLMELLKTDPPKKVLDKDVVRVDDSDGYKFILNDGSWLMLRLSGTEPILRIYSEAPNEKKAFAMIGFGKRIADNIK